MSENKTSCQKISKFRDALFVGKCLFDINLDSGGYGDGQIKKGNTVCSARFHLKFGFLL